MSPKELSVTYIPTTFDGLLKIVNTMQRENQRGIPKKEQKITTREDALALSRNTGISPLQILVSLHFGYKNHPK